MTTARSETLERVLDHISDMRNGKFDLRWMHANPDGWGTRAQPSALGLTLGDITVASILVNPRHAGFAPERKRFPKLRAFLDRMWSRPSFKKLIDEDTPIFGKRSALIQD
jgi:glutathione S-transferase